MAKHGRRPAEISILEAAAYLRIAEWNAMSTVYLMKVVSSYLTV